MSNKYEYKEGQRVYFNIDGKTKGWGYIRGCCGEYPAIGKQWIVEVKDPKPYDEKAYPFSSLAAFSVQIKLQPFELDSNPLEDQPVEETPTEESIPTIIETETDVK